MSVALEQNMRSAADGESTDSWVERTRAALQPPVLRLRNQAAQLEGLIGDPNLSVFSTDLRAICNAGSLLLTEFQRCMTILRTGSRDEAMFSRLRHDLRTPLNAIRGYSELLLEEDGVGGSCARALASLLTLTDEVLSALATYLSETVVIDGRHADITPAPAPAAPGLNFPLPPTDAARMDPGRILVVDDNQSNRDLLIRRLTREGHAITAVPDGRTALDLLAEHPFDLVLLDFEMPGLKGIDVLARIKSDPQLSAIPVVMLSAGTDVRRIADCLERGAEDYVAKPFEPVVLRARIGACLEKKRLREQHEMSWEQRLQAIMDMVVDGFVMLDDQGRIHALNPIAEQIFGASPRSLLGSEFGRLLDAEPGWRPDGWLERVGGRDGQSASDPTREVVGRRVGGERFPMDLSVKQMRGSGRRLFGAMVRDISARKAAEARTAYLARHDPITDLPNQTMFDERLEGWLEGRAQAFEDAPLASVLYLTFANYKEVSSVMGQSIGAALLRAVAERLRPLMQADDLLARLNGDEFAVLHPVGAAPPEALAEAMTTELRKEFSINTASIELDPHIGIAMIPLHGTTAIELMRKADIARERARSHPERPFCRFDEQMWIGIRARRTLERELRTALADGEFLLHYQPKLELATSRLVGAEVLIRWQHPIRGMIPPDQFIPAAEACGVIVGMGNWVIRTVCRQLAAWKADGIDVKLAINISANLMRRGDLLGVLSAATAETGIAPSSLEFEVTESVFLDEAEGARELLLKLRERGATVSIDDFGTGYCSLSYLHLLPVDKLKIDQSFIRRITDDATSQATTRAIIMLAKSMNLVSIAEGVERPEQAEFLRENRCDQAQGYLFSRPLDAERFWAFVQDSRQREAVLASCSSKRIS